MSRQAPPSPDFTNRRPPNKTYGRRSKPVQSGSSRRAEDSGQREPSTSPLTSPPPPSFMVEDDMDMNISGRVQVHTNPKASSSISGATGRSKVQDFMDGKIKAIENDDDVIKVANKVDIRPTASPTRPTLKRARPPSMADLTKPSSDQGSKRGRTNDVTIEPTAPINISSKSTYTFRPIPINDLVPLSTPPDLEGAASLRARQAAHTPRTPPRDLTALLGERVSPSPEGRKPPIGGGGLGLGVGEVYLGGSKDVMLGGTTTAVGKPGPLRKGRRKMMTRTESLGETDDMFRKKADEETDVRLPIVDPWNLSSPERKHSDLPGSGRNSPAVESPTTPRKLNRMISHQSPTGRDLKTPSPPRRQGGGLGRTASLPDSPSGKTALRHTLSTSGTLASLGGSVAAGSGPGRAVRTYGRRQVATPGDQTTQSNPGKVGQPQMRSSLNKETIFSDPPSSADGLENEVQGFLLSPDKPSIFQPLGNRAVPVQEDSYAELNKRFGVDVEDEDDFDPDSQGSLGDLKAPPSLADLRSKGENRRFMDELGYLRDGVHDDSLASRRSSAIDILSKCADASWFERLRVCGQIESIYEDFATAGKDQSDEALDLALLLYLAHLSRNSSDLEIVVQAHALDICHFLVNVIRERRISLIQTASGRRKKNPSMDFLRAVRTSLTGPGLTEEARTPLGMASGVLSIVIERCLERGFESSDLVPARDMAVVLASAIQQELGILPTRLELYGKGLELFAADQQPDFIVVLDCIRLIQSVITESVECKTVLQESYVTLAPLLADLLLLISLGNMMQMLSRTQTEELASCTLKVLLAVTQDSPAWSLSFLQGTAPYLGLLRLLLDLTGNGTQAKGAASPAPSEATITSWHEEPRIDAADITNLALGCLFNLVQEDLEHGHVMLVLPIGMPCYGSRKCIKGCQCPSKSPAIDHLVRMFLAQQKNKTEDAGAAFLSGYLALLFANMIDNKPKAAAQLLAALGEQDRQSKVELLVNNVEEFRNTYEKFQLHLTKGLQQRLAPDTDDDLEIVVDDENSSSMIQEALKVYEALQ